MNTIHPVDEGICFTARTIYLDLSYDITFHGENGDKATVDIKDDITAWESAQLSYLFMKVTLGYSNNLLDVTPEIKRLGIERHFKWE